MKVSGNSKLIGISMLFVVGLAACDKPGPAETTGKKMDQMADEAGKKIGEAADKVRD
jgi:hyperosmotically inducible periplasmic protein